MGDFLDFSRIETGRVQLVYSFVDIGKIIAGIVDELRPLAGDKHIELSYSASDQPVMVMVDPGKIRQIFLNIIENAIKYTDGGSVSVKLVRKDAHAEITVHDTGRGITPEEKKFIFQKFARGKEAARNSKGSGLGLYIANEFAHVHGGRIEVESEGLGKGSTFTVILPAKEKE